MHTTDKRIRGRKLQQIRRLHFSTHPFCVYCSKLGILRMATQLDHIVPLSLAGKDEPKNRQGLCDKCHEIKTAVDLGYRIMSKTNADGYPA